MSIVFNMLALSWIIFSELLLGAHFLEIVKMDSIRKYPPMLKVDKTVIGVNDTLRAVCRASLWPSDVPANITWSINGQQDSRAADKGSIMKSSLEIYPQSSLLKFFRAKNTSVNLQCKVTSLEVVKIFKQQIVLSMPPSKTISPNRLDLRRSKRNANEVPHSLALTAASQRCCIYYGAFGSILVAIFTMAISQLFT
ncbi:uncharacterized protein [Drosophila takahashii]|uniref:uncharacterized protein n=1 Tax=Drosophila takahashii TaxID=29030 RepID=UPI001CF852F6|nr:uncharacterized protein LOC108054211 [Drosophila takahashii]